MPRQVKVAVVGSGLAGLTAAYLLANPTNTKDVEFEVHLFEKVRFFFYLYPKDIKTILFGKASVLGMDSSSISVPVAGGDESWRVDVPMRSFQGGMTCQPYLIYPNRKWKRKRKS